MVLAGIEPGSLSHHNIVIKRPTCLSTAPCCNGQKMIHVRVHVVSIIPADTAWIWTGTFNHMKGLLLRARVVIIVVDKCIGHNLIFVIIDETTTFKSPLVYCSNSVNIVAADVK